MDDLLLNNEKLTARSPLGGNIDVDKYSFIIKETQIFVIEKILGTKLYKKILLEYGLNTLTGVYKTLQEEYIEPILIYTVSAEFITVGAFHISNGGVFRYLPENTEPLSKTELEFLASNQRNKADVYIERLQRFLCDSVNDIPEYDLPQDNNYDVRPDRDINTYGGWRLSNDHNYGTSAEREIWRDIFNDEGR